MCLSPLIVRDKKTSISAYVACRHCDRCRRNRLSDLVGRCVAEQSSSSGSVSVTLTYAGDGPETTALRYADFQKFLKRLRKHGYSVRYIVAGEYGTKKGRAHWHCVLFFKGKTPDVSLNERIEWPFWPHGFSFFQRPDAGGFAYVVKYALKAQGNDGESKALSMSKKPPLGYDFFMDLASDMVERGLAVHSPEYAFAHVRDTNDRARRYWLQGRMREMFLERYCQLWLEKYGTECPETDWLLERYLDPIARKEMESDPLRFERDRAVKQAEWDFKVANRKPDPLPYRHQLGFLMIGDPVIAMVVAYSDWTAEIIQGDQQWQITGSENAAKLARQLQRTGIRGLSPLRVSQWLREKWNLSPSLDQSSSRGG